jgi:hypothetical protein
METSFESPATFEARAIFRLVLAGSTTIDDARELIAVPERQERALKAFVAVSGKTGAPIGQALTFRHRVAAEFEKLLGETSQRVL